MRKTEMYLQFSMFPQLDSGTISEADTLLAALTETHPDHPLTEDVAFQYRTGKALIWEKEGRHNLSGRAWPEIERDTIISIPVFEMGVIQTSFWLFSSDESYVARKLTELRQKGNTLEDTLGGLKYLAAEHAEAVRLCLEFTELEIQYITENAR